MTNHTPTPWFKSVMHESTRTPEEVASFAGPNAGYVLRAVNCHEELVKALKDIIREQGFMSDAQEALLIKAGGLVGGQ